MNSTIEIKNVETVISEAETLSTSTVSLESARESIEYILNEIKEYWSQTQQDAQTFSTGLEKNVETLRTIVECNKEFAQAITNYAEAQDKSSKNVINIT